MALEVVGAGIIKTSIDELNFVPHDVSKKLVVPELKSGSAPTPAVAAPTPTGRLRGTAVPNSAPTPASGTRARLRATNISEVPGPAGTKHAHINGAKFEELIPDMNINHGWKIHGDFVKDIANETEALLKMGLGPKGSSSYGGHTGLQVIDQSTWQATAARLDKLGIPTGTDSQSLVHLRNALIFSRSEHVGTTPDTIVNGRPYKGMERFELRYSNPLDTISMMEVFDENQTQFKASAMYGEGREFTGYTQSIENRDKLISSLESRLGDRLEDVNPNILGGHQTEGATQVSKKITGRFTTEYTDIPSAGGAMDWASQNPAASKGQAAIDNVMATNPQMRPYIHTGVIDDQSAANLQKLTDDFPVFNEMLHGPDGYVSPYATIEDTFSQQGYDYKTGKALAPSTATAPPVTPVTPPPTPVTPPPTPPTATISQRKLDAIEEMAANGTDEEKEIAKKKLEELKRSGRVPRTGPSDLGRPTGIRTTPSAHGADEAAPHAGTGTKAADVAAEVTTDAPKVRVTNPPSSGAPSKTKTLLDDAAEAARNIARGHGNAKALGIAGAAALLGVGYVSTRNKNNPPRNQGTYMDESRRRLGY